MIMDFFRQKGVAQDAPEQKASATGPVMAWHGAGRVAWSPRDTVTLTRTGFSGNPVGFRCVKMIAEAAASLPLVLQDETQRFSEHPILALIKRPNPVQGAGRAVRGALWSVTADRQRLCRSGWRGCRCSA